jgi:hypothetical protein
MIDFSVDSFVADRFKNAIDTIHDRFGYARPGRQPDYLMGRWCVRCHNSLPEDWAGPCDICGAATGSILLDGLLADGPQCASTPIYRGIPREKS